MTCHNINGSKPVQAVWRERVGLLIELFWEVILRTHSGLKFVCCTYSYRS